MSPSSRSAGASSRCATWTAIPAWSASSATRRWPRALRKRYPAVRPGYHLDKRHWNTIDLDGTVPGDELAELIDHSWELVVAKLPRRQRDTLAPPDLPRSAPGRLGP
jgi:hypothetical protein